MDGERIMRSVARFDDIYANEVHPTSKFAISDWTPSDDGDEIGYY